jgi:hypothetical protein
MMMEKEKIVINDLMEEGLNKMVYWGKFFAVLGFVMIGFLLLGGVGMLFSPMSSTSSVLATMPEFEQFGSMMKYYSLFYIVTAALYYFPSKYLYDFSVLGRKALVRSSTDDMGKALSSLGSAFKFWGVFTIVLFSVYVVVLLGGVLTLLMM